MWALVPQLGTLTFLVQLHIAHYMKYHHVQQQFENKYSVSSEKTESSFLIYLLKCILYSQDCVNLSVNVGEKGQTGGCSSSLNQYFFWRTSWQHLRMQFWLLINSFFLNIVFASAIKNCDMEFWSMLLGIQLPFKNVSSVEVTTIFNKASKDIRFRLEPH